jgi:hypothetical protein
MTTIETPASPLDSLIPLTEGAQHVPGRPTANCLWRWCRRGVLARDGSRIRLEHVRVGGRVMTSVEWIREFGQRLSAADAAYFDAKIAGSQQEPPRAAQFAAPKRPRQRKQRRAAEDPGRAARVRDELDREDL